MTTTSLPVVAGVSIPVDDQGRYNLNALHRAHEAVVGEKQMHKRPSEWLKNKQAQEFIQAVIECNNIQSANSISGGESSTCDVLNVVNGGNAPGTFAHELIAVEYAGWISPKFRIMVNQTFIDYRTGKLQPTTPTEKHQYTEFEAMQFALLTTQVAKEMGLSGNQIALSADTAVKTVTGISPLQLMGQTHLVADQRGRTYTPTELGKMMEPPASARMVNKLFEKSGLIALNPDREWVPTEHAEGLYEWYDTHKKHKSGVPIKQLKWFLDVLKLIGIAFSEHLLPPILH